MNALSCSPQIESLATTCTCDVASLMFLDSKTALQASSSSGEQYKRSTGATRNLVAICWLVIGVRRDGYVWANLARLRTDPKIFYRFRFGPTRAGGACGRI